MTSKKAEAQQQPEWKPYKLRMTVEVAEIDGKKVARDGKGRKWEVEQSEFDKHYKPV